MLYENRDGFIKNRINLKSKTMELLVVEGSTIVFNYKSNIDPMEMLLIATARINNSPMATLIY